MKKFRFMLMIGAMLIGFGAMAQVSFGPKVGLNLSNQSGDDVENNSMLIGINGGVAANMMFSEMFGLQGELLFDMKGANYEITNENNEKEDIPYRLNYITIPILGQVVFGEDVKFYGELGPTIGILMSASIDGETEMTVANETIKYKDNFKSTDIGLAFGAGAKLPMDAFDLVIGARYNLGLTSVGEEMEQITGFDPVTFQPITETVTPDIKNGVISINVALMFGGQ